VTPEQAVLERVLDIADVAALVGARGYLLKLPQGPTLPAVRVQLIDEVGDPHLRGSGGPKRSRVQVDAFAPEASGSDPYAVASAVADAIAGPGDGTGLDGWIGSSGGSPAVTVTGAFLIDRAVSYEPGELRLVRVRQDYLVRWHS
jgi:hypothetical protein